MNKMNECQFKLNDNRALNPKRTMRENGIDDMDEVRITPKGIGGSQTEQTSLLSHGFKRKRIKCKT